MAAPAFLPKQQIIYFYYADMQLIFCKGRKYLRTKQVHNGS